MPDKQPTFAQRIELLRLAVKALDDVANTIDAEVERMIVAAEALCRAQRRKDRTASSHVARRPYQLHHCTMTNI